MRRNGAEALRNESGAIAVEYGILVALLAVSIVVLVGDVGEGVNEILERVAGYFPSLPD